MPFYSVTTEKSVDKVFGDSMADRFCLRPVAETHFNAMIRAGHPLVLMHAWNDDGCREVARYCQERRMPSAEFWRKLLKTKAILLS